MKVTCPTCRREIEWAESAFRPFCSERCRLIDLGAWLAEKHSIPGEPLPDDSNPSTGEGPDPERH